MGTSDINLHSLYTELYKCETNEDYDKAYKLASKISDESPNDVKAFQAKVISLVRLGKFKEALTSLDSTSIFAETLILEKAYCYYRLNELNQALLTIRSIKEPTLASKELEAQILYRSESYEECFDIYRQIIKHNYDEYEDERATNMAAVISHYTIMGNSKEYSIPERTYEQLYNSACTLVEQQRYSQAVKKLLQSEELCREILEEDGSTEEEILEETAIIRGQRAFCLQMIGKIKEALEIYSGILRQKPKDIGLVAIASNNSMTISKDQNIFDMKKKLRSVTVDGLEYKLTSNQIAAITFNQCVIALSTNQSSLCIQLCEKLKEKYPMMEVDAIIIQAFVLSKQKKIEEAVKLLLNYANSASSKNQIKAKLTATQILLTQENKTAACEILENLDSYYMYKPAVISTLVSLYNTLGYREKASKFLEDAVQWHTKNKEENIDLSPLWREIAEFQLEGGDPHIAANSLQELLKLHPGNKKIIAKLVIAYAQFDEENALKYSEQLPQLKTDGINIETVLRSNWTNQSKLKKAIAKVETPQQTQQKVLTTATELLIREKKKTKRKRKPRLPKNYDPNVEPDPNRWLPKHERQGIRKRRDKRIIKEPTIGKGTQGTTSASSDQFDITKMAPQPKSAPSNVVPQDGPRLHQRGRIQHKKKKGR